MAVARMERTLVAQEVENKNQRTVEPEMRSQPRCGSGYSGFDTYCPYLGRGDPEIGRDFRCTCQAGLDQQELIGIVYLATKCTKCLLGN